MSKTEREKSEYLKGLYTGFFFCVIVVIVFIILIKNGI